MLESNKLSVSKQSAAVARETSRVLGHSNKDSSSRDEILISLHSVLVRPPMEYCAQC